MRHNQQARLPHYGPEVQQALLLAWKAANQICSKRLIPFLPTLVEALERHGHLHLSEECRHQLLSISATTADRLLRGSRQQHPHSVSTTRAGTLLKHQIPIRTFQDWNETQPGLTSSRSGRPLRQTDRGRLPLHGFRSPTLLRAGPNASRFSTAVRKRCWQPSNRHERSFLSPFWVSIPITVVSSSMRKCSRTVSKNRLRLPEGGLIKKEISALSNKRIEPSFVRSWAMIAWLGNMQARQLTELYRALRLYVNCFQPSMKLLSKQRDGKKVRYVYDPAKTPLQRLLLSGVLIAQKQQELIEVTHALDPIRLFQQIEQVQKAVFRYVVSCSPLVSSTPSAPIRIFSVESCSVGNVPAERSLSDPSPAFHILYQEQERRKRVLGWRRTHKDPFEGEWEQITSWLIANPERSSGDIFRELQHRSPGRYQP